jgi:hypothetical protein
MVRVYLLRQKAIFKPILNFTLLFFSPLYIYWYGNYA